jgi:hypothetical protein
MAPNTEEFMKKPLIIMVLCCFPAIAFTVPAEARPGGCIKGALMACIGGTNTIGNGRRLAAPATRQMDLRANRGDDETS